MNRETMMTAGVLSGLAGLAPLAAEAQTLAGETATRLDLGWLASLAQPYVETLLVTTLSALAGWAVARLNRWLGLQIDASHKQALHEAIRRGVARAASLLVTEVQARASVDLRSALIARAARYVEETMPDALAHFGLTAEALDALIEAHLPQGLEQRTDVAGVGAGEPS